MDGFDPKQATDPVADGNATPPVGAQHAVPALLDIEELEAIYARCVKVGEKDAMSAAHGFAVAFIGAVPRMLTEIRQNRAEITRIHSENVQLRTDRSNRIDAGMLSIVDYARSS